MVKIEDITEREEERKLHFKKTRELLDKFFDNISISSTPPVITAYDRNESRNFLFIHPPDEITLSIPKSAISKYTDKTLAFAKEYEKKFNVKVTLQTDYSK
jgi:hypothetical protein